MDLTNPNYFEAPSLFAFHGEPPLEGNTGFYKKSKDNPFADTNFPDPLCKLNLKETSEFVKSLPMANNGVENRGFLEVSAQRRREGFSSVTRRNVEAPSTPGRPIFSFSTVGNLSRKSFPSKWDDAEKWVNSSSSCHDSPAHHHGLKSSESSKIPKQCDGLKQHQAEFFAEKSRVTEEKVSSFQGSLSLDHQPFNGVDVLLKDKFTNEVEVEPNFPKFRCSELMKEGFLFGNSVDKSMKDAATEVVHEVKHRDIGTEMTPLGSSTTSRCHTPFKSSSPARHNTPADRSGPLAALVNSNSTNNTSIDITQLQECHLAKLQLGTQFDSVTSNWSSREEEEEDISKSLRYCDISNECRKSVSESRACAWEEEKNKCCLRYQREEAKIQAWVNLQSAKAEAQSRKLEVKIQKMRSNLEEKLMKRMAAVHRKAEEWRAGAQLQHSEQIQRTTEQAQQKMLNRRSSHCSGHTSCSCFPCSNYHHH
uniref:Remorin C-terminal domain-containing protein n=1 Tax=Davidia involucrata TaxID=16924 RepID=A0A5B7AX67_DAVIN